jgi:protein TonB
LLAAHFTYNAESRGVALAATVLLHAVLLVALLSQAHVRTALRNAAPLMVRLISTPAMATPAQPPRPLPLRTVERTPQPTIAPAPPSEMQVPSAFAAISPDVATPAPEPSLPGPAAPLPIIPPNFNAAYLDNPAPVYPPLARRSGEQGRVVLRVLVTPTGTADAVELRTSSGSARLDQAAIETVKRWRFVAARQGEQTVAAWVLVPITFSLER